MKRHLDTDHQPSTPSSAALAVVVSERPSVTFVHSVETNKGIFNFFSPSGSHTILVFPYQTSWQYSDGEPPNGSVECKWGRQKSRFWANIWLHGVLWTRSAIHLTATDQRVDDTSRWWATEFFSDWRRRRRVGPYDKKPQCYAEDNRAAFNCTHLINDLKLKLRSRYYTVEARTTDGHKASRGPSATAELRYL